MGVPAHVVAAFAGVATRPVASELRGIVDFEHLYPHGTKHLLCRLVAGSPFGDYRVGLANRLEWILIWLLVREIQRDAILSHDLSVEGSGDGRQVEPEILDDSRGLFLGLFINSDSYGSHNKLLT